ncbi:M23 family metallopeptidase [Allostreptomyces psammosilenae]|uniref:Murein DD-endopeptidase MepM/ murein hydrolase activator NlpD n=1 Tax=Allostreptomyces psammosilenae TaxID=1892865 RepID=A0A852ZQ35_9ACTN|nr:M23 family metallopeptidase [Allostreptomyces psammosilenae]NYI04556.1 murein DD-endopeptidase MepM/ murein hydrolase activator NlpD [Allostreptomyces psammosilenae]
MTITRTTATGRITSTLGGLRRASARTVAAATMLAAATAGMTGTALAATHATAVPVATVAEAKAATSGFALPIEGSYTLSASFAQAGSNWASTHSGQDFAVPTGTGVDTVSDGVVYSASYDSSYGNNVIVQNADGKYVLYGHLSEMTVTAGQKVSAGDRVGLSGNTGNSTGPHLHFEVRTTPVYGSAINPVDYLAANGITI